MAATFPYLAELSVENLAVIERVRVPFGPGFVALTGETGVGKSLIVDALRLLSGGRASSDVIRSGAKQAVVEGVFHQVPAALLAPLRAAGVLAPAEEDDPSESELVIRRVLRPDGHNAVYVNDRRVGVALLTELGDLLIDLLGQHAQRSLLSESGHVRLLDGVGGLRQEADGYRQALSRCQALDARIVEEAAGRQEAEAREAFLRFAVDEIHAAELQEDEEAVLTAELARLSHAEQLRTFAADAYSGLYGGDRAVLSALEGVVTQVGEIEHLSPGQCDAKGLLAEAQVLLDEAANSLRVFRDQARPDGERQAQVEQRLAEIEALKRKYGRSLPEVLEAASRYAAELAQAGSAGERLEQLEAERAALLEQLGQQATVLHTRRGKAAVELQRVVGKGLARLGMKNARLHVEQVPYDRGELWNEQHLGGDGLARVRFLLAANPGEQAKPLARVASGGELSRIMLALKLALIEADPVPCLIFDEVDAGIGGAVAEQVGHMLKTLSSHHQVFCVTHLAQIAALADQHLCVQKQVDGKRTHTRVEALAPDQREAEVARMLGGNDITDIGRRHAREMLAG